MKKFLSFAKTTLLLTLALFIVLSYASCSGTNTDTSDSTAEGEQSAQPTEPVTTPVTTQPTEDDKIDEHTYDIYVTLGTMPTLYATLNAYDRQNPNTYMWFLRGNTISYEHSADFIHYFPTQSKTNASSEIDYSQIREKIKQIKQDDEQAVFNFYCDDLRVSLIAHIFIYAGVDFEDINITLLSDGTGTYNNYSYQTDKYYTDYASTWQNAVKTYTDGRGNESFEPPYKDDGTAMDLQYLAFYMSTFDNVEYWVQNPEYLVCDSEVVKTEREKMHIIEKDPKLLYASLDESVREEYKKVVLANALVDSDTLKTLDDAKKYFDENLLGRDKEVVLILGTNKQTLAENKFYIDSTLNYYTPTLAEDGKTASYKGKSYEVSDNTITCDGKQLQVGSLGVYLYFKGHPAYPADDGLKSYFEANGIKMLPHRTPVETIFWLYDVKAGGYESTSFLSCYKGQIEFMYEQPASEAIVQMSQAGFFDNAAVFLNTFENTEDQ